MTKALGKKEQGWLEFKYQPTDEVIRFPVGTVYGVEEGPTLVVVGGMHGSEFCGIEAAIRLFREVEPEKLKGTLKVVMIYNLPAFESNLGFLVPQDGVNPGRVFPGDPNGSFSEVMAYHLSENVLRTADYYVELHGGDIPEALVPFVNAPITGVEEVDKKSREMAMVFNIALVVGGDLTKLPRPLHTSGFRAMTLEGIPAILAESGQQGILTMEDTERHLVGLRNIMIHLGMREGTIVNTVKRMFSAEHAAIRAEFDAMWYPAVKLGDWATTGQVIGEYRTVFGEHLADVKAPFDGHITVIRTSPHVDTGNVVIEIDRVVEREA